MEIRERVGIKGGSGKLSPNFISVSGIMYMMHPLT